MDLSWLLTNSLETGEIFLLICEALLVAVEVLTIIGPLPVNIEWLGENLFPVPVRIELVGDILLLNQLSFWMMFMEPWGIFSSYLIFLSIYNYYGCIFKILWLLLNKLLALFGTKFVGIIFFASSFLFFKYFNLYLI